MIYALGITLLQLFSSNPIIEDLFFSYNQEFKSTNSKFINSEILDLFENVKNLCEFLYGLKSPVLVDIIKKIFVLKSSLSILELYELIINKIVLKKAFKKNNIPKNKINQILRFDSNTKEPKKFCSCLNFLFRY